MSDDKDKKDAAKAPGKMAKLGKIIAMVVGVLLLLGGGVGAGLYAASSGLLGSGHGGGHESAAENHPGPKLVPKSEQKRPGDGAEDSGHGGGGEEHADSGEAKDNAGMPTPIGDGGERYASNYYELPKDFTSNLRDSVHVVQVGLAVSTPYDDTVIRNLKTNDLAVRSAILLTLGDTTEEQVFTSEGKRQVQRKLVNAINEVLRQKEGFGGIANVYFTNFVVQ
ncbi:flagellar basal body-associated FliL family protein [Sphingomonadaceae bacterium jetA1]|jgi:flagellar FliL protein|uniref:flagellar basal body-associated FliL family protein n=1 Tax=Facivitalis istanbulensis TaxID=3075838 RepID=UPI00346CECD5